MDKTTKAAIRANGLSRACAKCEIALHDNICNERTHRVCSLSFVEGFKKGAAWAKREMKKEEGR